MTFQELLAGDIILFKWNGILFHAAIFAPEEDRASNIIDATSNKGVSRNTLEGLYHVLLGVHKVGNLFGLFSNVFEVSAVRSKKLDGQTIADQAEFWRLQGLTYDVRSLADTVEATLTPPVVMTPEMEEANIRKYLEYATRSNEPMIPNPVKASFFIEVCTYFLAPLWNFPLVVFNFFVRLIQYWTQEEEKTVSEKGVNCVGFVLSVLGAVALKEQTLDLDECKKKLGGITQINPLLYNINTVMDKVFKDPEYFDDMGILDPHALSSKPFNKQTFHEEQVEDSIAQRKLGFRVS